MLHDDFDLHHTTLQVDHQGSDLLDIEMPRMDGYEVARRLRARAGGDDLLLIALTGYGQAEDKQRALEAGFDYHLVKPVDPGVLEKLLARRANG